MEFMSAMQDYKQRSGRMFPTWSEVLEVLGGLGYIKSPSAIYSSAASGGSSNGHDLGRIERRQAATQTPLNGSINADLRPKVACKSR